MWALPSGHRSPRRDENAWFVAPSFHILVPPPSAPATAGEGPRLSRVSMEVTRSECLALDPWESTYITPAAEGPRTPGGLDLLRVFREVWREIGFCSVLEATGMGGGLSLEGMRRSVDTKRRVAGRRHCGRGRPLRAPASSSEEQEDGGAGLLLPCVCSPGLTAPHPSSPLGEPLLNT